MIGSKNGERKAPQGRKTLGGAHSADYLVTAALGGP